MKKIVFSFYLAACAPLFSEVTKIEFRNDEHEKAVKENLVEFAKSTNFSARSETHKKIPNVSEYIQENRKLVAVVNKVYNYTFESIPFDECFEFENQEDVNTIAKELDLDSGETATISIVWCYLDSEK